MGSSSENTLTCFDLDLLLSSASTAITENTEHDYQTNIVELAGSKTPSYQVEDIEISGPIHHGYQIPNMGNTATSNQGYQVQNIRITGTSEEDYQIPNLGNTGAVNQDYQVQNIGITGTTDNGYQIPNMENTGTGNQGYKVQNIGIPGTKDHDYQIQHMRTPNQGYQLQNTSNKLSFFDHVSNEVVKKSDYEVLESRLQTISADFVSLQKDYDSKSKDYDAVKKQYAKLALDYANLNTQNKDHAMESLNISAKCENMERKEVEYLAAINALNKQCEKQSLDIYAQSKQFIQYQSHVEDLRAEISDLKSNVKSEKGIGKDSRKMISTLTNNNQTLAEHLCLFACVIEGRKQLDKDTRRYIKKYCKKSTSSSKKSMEIESFENQSVDAGRGSSLAFSDGDRSFYSPSYSITLSPISAGATTPRNEQTKMTRDASSSPPPMTKTFDISTSPIPAIRTCDVATNTMTYYEAKKTRDVNTSPIEFAHSRTSVATTQTWSFTTISTEFDVTRNLLDKTLNIAAGPTEFHDTRTPAANIQTWSMTTSPTEFDETETPKAKTLNIATSPTEFDDTRTPADNLQTWSMTISPTEFDDTETPIAKTLNIATSPVKFNDMRSPLVKTKTLNMGTSPIAFEDRNTPNSKSKTTNIATSPIAFEDRHTPISKSKTSNIATSPIAFEDRNTPNSKSKTTNIATSPIAFEDRNTPISKSKTSNIATSPIAFEDRNNPISKSKTSNIATSPIAFEARNTAVSKSKTSNIATSPIVFEDTKTPVSKLKTLNIATSPIAFKDRITPLNKANTSNIATSPIVFEDRNTPVSKPKTSNIATSPVKLDNLRSLPPNANTLNIATNPMCAPTPLDKKKPLDIATSPINYNYTTKTVSMTKLPKTSDMTKPKKSATARTPLVKTKTLHANSTENFKPTNSAASNFNNHRNKDKVESPVPKCTDFKTSTAPHINKITEKLREIVSKQADYSENDAENDWEINMILSKHRLNWALLSPISLTPEQDQENEPNQSERKDETEQQRCHINGKENKTSDILAQSLHLFGETDSDDEIDSEDCHINDFTIEDPQHEVNSDDVFDLMKTGDDAENEVIENNVSELPDEISNMNHAKPFKTRGVSTKYKKLTNLQKIYKANVPKSKIKSQYPQSVKKQKTRPKSHSIPIIKSVATVPNEEKSKKLSELNATLLHKRRDVAVKVYKASIKCNSKEPLVFSESGTKIGSTETLPNRSLPLTQTNLNPPPESGPKRRVSMTKDNEETLYALSESAQQKKVKNSGLHHPQMNPLLESKTESSINIKYEHSKVQPNQPTECGPTSLPAELIIESDVAYTYPKPTIKRISRVKRGISTDPHVLPSDRTENNNNNDILSCIKSQYSPLKRPLNRPANDLVINEEFDVKRKRVAQNVAINDPSIDTSQVIDESVIDNIHGSTNHQTSASLNISEADTPMSPDAASIKPISLTKSPDYQTRSCADYKDMTMFTAPTNDLKKHSCDETAENWSHNLLDRMLYKYGSKPGIMDTPKCDEVIVLKIKTGVAKCVKSMLNQDEYAKALQQLVQELVVKGKKKIICGLMKFLNDPARKAEFIPNNKNQKGYINEPTASQTEMALIDVIEQLEKSGVDLWELILDSSEFILFTLERGATPVFDVVESVAHFYANICRYRRNMSRMWMFMLNAMYCLSFKAIPILKNCLDVVPEVIPYANKYLEPGLAPLIRCLVFLLNFYNCDDPFKRVDEIRRRLRNKYYYNLQDENETTLLFLLRQSIINLTEKKLERDMLELSLLIVAKRRGTKWCHKNIVQKILLPMIKGEIDVSYRAKRFCITTIGYILKPYNNEMVVHAEEVVNLLLKMFDQQSQPQEMKEDIIRGLVNMDMKTITVRINTCLRNWNPPSVSPELEEALESYIRKKYIRNWLTIYQDHYKES